MNFYNNREMHAQTGKKVYLILFLAFVRLPIYCVYTQFLNKIMSFLSFFTFSPAPVVSILSPKYQS